MNFHMMRRQLSSNSLTDTVKVVKMCKVKPQSSSCFLSKFMKQSAIKGTPAPDYRASSYTEELKVQYFFPIRELQYPSFLDHLKGSSPAEPAHSSSA